MPLLQSLLPSTFTLNTLLREREGPRLLMHPSAPSFILSHRSSNEPRFNCARFTDESTVHTQRE